MIFNSFTFIVFLAAMVSLYWALPRRPRLLLLFGGSLVFYGFWRVEFIPLLLISTATDYWVARGIHASGNAKRRKRLLWLSLAVNFGLLGFFKYTYFFVDSVNALALVSGLAPSGGPNDGLSVPFDIILPLGISFYTFQSVSYTIDVYRGFRKPERGFLLFGTYVIFFPQLVAGPILRAGEVIWQLDKRPRFDRTDIGLGLHRILQGLFLKCVLADNLARLVDQGFATPVAGLSAPDIWTLGFTFGFQIYFDFAGYSHIAIGAARLMGIRFPENFNFPYLASSPREFWRRWHISLSSWIRDYLYLPLCGATVRDESVGGLQMVEQTPRPISAARRVFALWATWALMGLWHGANWRFVLWGLWHAALVSAQRLLGGLIPWKVPAPVGWGITLPLVMLGWIPFRAETLGDSLAMLARVFDPSAYINPLTGFAQGSLPSIWLTLHRDTYYVSAAMLVAVSGAWAAQRWVIPTMSRSPWTLAAAETGAYTVMAGLVFVFLQPISQFIYFQF